MAELGKAAGVKIVTDAFEQAAALARELGGDAKPSGAGGGDVGVALFATPEAAALFVRACQPAVSVLDVSLARSGVYRRSAEEPLVESRDPFMSDKQHSSRIPEFRHLSLADRRRELAAHAE